MKRAAASLLVLLGRIVVVIWPETVLLAAGAILLAVGSSFISPAGPWLVIGATFIGLGIMATYPQRSR